MNKPTCAFFGLAGFLLLHSLSLRAGGDEVVGTAPLVRFSLAPLGENDAILRVCLPTEFRVQSATLLVEGKGLSSLQVPVMPVTGEAGWQYLTFSVFGTDWSFGRGPVRLSLKIATAENQYVQSERYVIADIVGELRKNPTRDEKQLTEPNCNESTAATTGQIFKQVGIKL